jgi:eukaryotic-like serine/threonine-protein kinase
VSAEQRAASALVGSVLEGVYRIDGLLGEGGMGAVYSATHLRLDKRVAVKVMASELGTATEALARFHREALVTSGLGHPNIVQVFDFSTTPTGEPFLVMEFLDGEDLDRRLHRVRRLAPDATWHIVKQVGAALLATHKKGIVHRDLKPANVYLVEAAGAADFVKVLDFGISKVRSATTKLTRTASIMGTPGYMSPEQARGRVEDIDERTDQWALACIAWECLAGEPPFQGESPLATLFQVVNEPPPPLLPKVPGLAPQVEAVLLRALAKNKQDRYAGIGDFAAALEAAMTGPRAEQRSVPPTVQLSQQELGQRPGQTTTFSQTTGELDGLAPVRSKGWVWAVAAGAAVLVIVGAILLLRSGPAPQPASAHPPVPAPAPEPAPAPVPVPTPAEPAPPPTAVVPEEKPTEPAKARGPERKPAGRSPSPRPRPGRRMIEDL